MLRAATTERLREIVSGALGVIQSRSGSLVARTAWTALGVMLFLRYEGTIMTAIFAAWTAVVSRHYQGNPWLLALRILGPLPILFFAVLWVLVFIRLRPRKEYPETLIALVRFWENYRKLRQAVEDILHEEVIWTVSVPSNLESDGSLSTGALYPSIQVKLPPRCVKCSFDIVESQFKGGFYWRCSACDFLRIGRTSLEKAGAEIERLARRAWEFQAR